MNQTDFWKGCAGQAITGTPQESFLSDMSVIPEGTTAQGMIKSFKLVEKQDKFGNTEDTYFEISWRLITGEFKNRLVSQKIKVFNGKPESIDRNKNMLMLIMKLFEFKPSHSGVPTDLELSSLNGKIASILIGEWEMMKSDGSGIINGNFIREVHLASSLPDETGIKKEPQVRTSKPNLDSAFSRQRELQQNNVNNDPFETDIPF